MKSLTFNINIVFLLALFVSVATFPAQGQDCGSSCTESLVATCDKSKENANCCGVCQEDCGGFDMGEMENCLICSQILQEMDLMAACTYSVFNSKDGLVFNFNLNKPELMTRLRDFQKKDKALCDKLKTKPLATIKDKLCTGCSEYLAFTKRGMTEENIDTPNGTIFITRTSDPILLKDVHAWGDRLKKAMGDHEAHEKAVLAEASAARIDASVKKVIEDYENAVLAEASAASIEACPITGNTEGVCTAKAEVEAPSGMDLSVFKDCHACSLMMENPQYMTMADCNVVDLDHGMIIYSAVKDLKNLKAYHALNEKFMNRVAEVKRMPKAVAEKKMCPICKSFADLEISGAVIENKNTTAGALTMIFSTNPEVIKKIKGLAKQFQSMSGM